MKLDENRMLDFLIELEKSVDVYNYLSCGSGADHAALLWAIDCGYIACDPYALDKYRLTYAGHQHLKRIRTVSLLESVEEPKLQDCNGEPLNVGDKFAYYIDSAILFSEVIVIERGVITAKSGCFDTTTIERYRVTKILPEVKV